MDMKGRNDITYEIKSRMLLHAMLGYLQNQLRSHILVAFLIIATYWFAYFIIGLKEVQYLIVHKNNPIK